MKDTGAVNAVVGDLDDTTLPVTTVDEQVLTEEKKMAKYSKTAEFQRLKTFMEARIEFFQKHLPDGTEIDKVQLNDTQLAVQWMSANVIIREFQNVLNEYQQAKEVVEDADRRLV